MGGLQSDMEYDMGRSDLLNECMHHELHIAHIYIEWVKVKLSQAVSLPFHSHSQGPKVTTTVD